MRALSLVLVSLTLVTLLHQHLPTLFGRPEFFPEMSNIAAAQPRYFVAVLFERLSYALQNGALGVLGVTLLRMLLRTTTAAFVAARLHDPEHHQALLRNLRVRTFSVVPNAGAINGTHMAVKERLARYISEELLGRAQGGGRTVAPDDDLLGSGLVDSLGIMSRPMTLGGTESCGHAPNGIPLRGPMLSPCPPVP